MMSRTEIVDVLKAISAADRRKITDVDVDLWHAALRDQNRDDCVAAVIEHVRTSEVWIMPVHVIRLAKAIAGDRWARMSEPERMAIVARRDAARDSEIAQRHARRITE